MNKLVAQSSNDALVVITTTETLVDGERLATALVESELAACVQIIPQISSVYRWQGKIEKSAETLLLIKTTRDNFSALSAAIQTLHAYQTPEILALPVEQASTDYLTWLWASVKLPPQSAASD